MRTTLSRKASSSSPSLHVPCQTLIGPLLANFLEKYPDVRLVSVLSDHVVHLLRNGFDLALAVGPPADSDLVAVKLGTTECGASGAPGYFERKGHAEGPAMSQASRLIRSSTGRTAV